MNDLPQTNVSICIHTVAPYFVVHSSTYVAICIYEYVLVLIHEFKIYCFITLISMQNLQQLYIELVNDSSFSEVCI